MIASPSFLTKDSSKYIRQVVAALPHFAEVLIYDTGSKDNTCEIAKQFPNVTIHHGPFEGFGLTHNRATAVAKHDWILSIDSDEVVSRAGSRDQLNRFG